jgi:hypothetical protein
MSQQPQFVVETITMTTVTERRLIKTDSDIPPLPPSVMNNNEANAAGLVQPAPSVNPNDLRVMQQKQIAAQLMQQQLKQQQMMQQQGINLFIFRLVTPFYTFVILAPATQPMIMITTTTTSALSSLTTAVAATDSQNNTTPTITTQMSTTAITSPYEIGKNRSMSTAQAISGILKGGKLWKHEHQTVSTVKISHPILKALEGYLKLNFQS